MAAKIRTGPNVIIVNEIMANRYWPGESALGKRLSFRSRPQEKDWIQIIGIVRDVKDEPTAPPTIPRSGCHTRSRPRETCSS